MKCRLVFLAVFALTLTSCGEKGPDFDACKSGQNADQRIAACTRLIGTEQLSSPDLANAFHQRGAAWAAKRDFDRAIADFDEALRANPIHAFAHYDRFMAQQNKGEKPIEKKKSVGVSAKEAKPQASTPTDSSGHVNRGVALAEKRDHDRAIVEYNEAVRVDPKNANAYYNRAISWGNKRDYDRAIADYGEAIRLNPQYAKAYNNRGLAWANGKRDYDQAIADYTEALRHDPKDSLAHNNRGVAWRAKRDYDRAIADYTEAIRLNPQYALAHYNRGVAWSDKRNYVNAIADYNEATRINPQSLNAHNSAAWLLATAPVAAVRNGARAVEFARKAAELTAWKDGDVLDTLAAAYAEAGNFPEAVSWQEKAMEFPDFMKSQGDDARKRLELYRKRQAYRQAGQ